VNNLLIGGTVTGWIGCILCFSLWQESKEDLAAEVERCNADKLASITQAQDETRIALQRIHDNELAQIERNITLAQQARDTAQAAADQAESLLAGQAARITQLELEANIDEIPSYADCSIVYIPRSVLYAEGCHADGSGDGNDYRVCVGASGLNPADSAFTNITIGDAHRLWTRDRAALGACNGRLDGIRNLTGEEHPR